MRIEQVTLATSALIDSLCDLLIDSVHGGAAVGFLAPLAPTEAAAYWREVFGKLSSNHVLFVARHRGKVLGAVQLALCERDDGRHRAEVQKLLVLSTCQGQGLATMLMRELETFALDQGRQLLVLGADAGSKADSVYRHLGWQHAGEIPAYTKCPCGELHATAYFYKQLAALDTGR